MDVAAGGVLLEEQHQPRPEHERRTGGDENTEQTVVLENGLNPQRALVNDEAHLFDADETPSLQRRDEHGCGLHPPTLEVPLCVGREDKANHVLDEEDEPQPKQRTDKEFRR